MRNIGFRTTLSKKTVAYIRKRLLEGSMNEAPKPFPNSKTLRVGIAATCIGLLLLLFTCPLAFFISRSSSMYQAGLFALLTSAVWLLSLGNMILLPAHGIIRFSRYLFLLLIPIVSYLYVTTFDMRYWSAGISLFWCSMLVELAGTLHREFDILIKGIRRLLLGTTWLMSVCALVLMSIYLIPPQLIKDIEIVQFVQNQSLTPLLFIGYALLSLLKRGITPNEKERAELMIK